MNNVVKLPAMRNDLANLSDAIKEFVYEQAVGLTIIEVVGVLELVKIDIYNEASWED